MNTKIPHVLSRAQTWLRPAVFGVTDGLVSNMALIAGVAAAGAPAGAVLLAGLAGLAAGAFSMATGEYVSVTAHVEHTEAREQDDDGSHPVVAAVASFISFAAGAVVPLLPYLLGWHSVAAVVGAGTLTLFGCGALTAALTRRSPWFSGARQMVLGALAAAATYGVGSAAGAILG